MKKLFKWVFLIVCNTAAGQQFGVAPDTQFSQFFGNPLYHNPAFAGESGTTRLMTTFRSQWTGLGERGYRSFQAGADAYLIDGFSIGGFALRDEQFKNFSTTNLSIMGSSNFIINDNNVIRVGLQGSWIFNQIADLSVLKFADQFSPGTTSVSVNPSTDPISNRGSLNWNFPDFSSGLIWKHSAHNDDIPLVWAGVSWHHMKFRENDFRPKGRVGVQAGIKIPHNMNFIGHGTAKDMGREKTISFTSYFRTQGGFKQLDLGVNLQYDPIILGLWYRNIPFRRFDFAGNDALTFIAGVRMGKFLIEYSYDLTISSLSRATAGANEITLWYGLEAFLDVSFSGLDRKRKLKCTNF